MTETCSHPRTTWFSYNDWVNPIEHEQVCIECGKSLQKMYESRSASTTEVATPRNKEQSLSV